MSVIVVNLVEAARRYSGCAKTVTRNMTNPLQPSPLESEQVIGFGIASDWNRRAATLTAISYHKRIKGSVVHRSMKRNGGVTELVRFNLAWYAMNALFSRTSILHLLGAPASNSELDKFKLIYSHANLTATTIAPILGTLHTILDSKHVTRIPGRAAGTPVTTLEAIFLKYTPAEVQKTANGKIIESAIKTKKLTHLGLPLLIYLMRNWTVHGSMMDGAFGSIVGFKKYIETILIALSVVHADGAKALEANL